MADQLGLSLDATPPGTYRQRGTSSLQRLFRTHFPELCARYESTYASRLGRFRLHRISSAVEHFLGCGDYTKGIARIQCTNPDCKADYFRPFSCKVFYLCPSCSQKRTLLFGEYMNEHLLLLLPHRQMVFTFPKVLRAFFRHDRRLYGEISKLVYRMIQSFYNAAAGRRIHSAAVVAYASAGEFARWNPHLHAIFLAGGFDREGRFVHMPCLDLAKLSQYFRSSMVAFFLKRTLLNERLAKNILGWTHSGFSVDLSVKIPASSSKAREALAQYIARPPVSLQKMLVEEHDGSVLYR
ncbi:MAG: transposase zinc-binding domain-containing protein, partial [Chloroflexi bacterium]|nr:transposase zinc-binding domain-containing protein [Chloroflexota bacterium]